jgi:UDP-N-acetylglucosamine--N-acetylmuramyl-(pentapeptide) pyrophosphoryl-undecaprenol N-acetylglucosamine transferase
MHHRNAILFAGGGTGGHIFPSLAVAEQIEAIAGDAAPPMHFVCSQRPLDADLLTKHGRSFTALPIEGLPSSPAKLLRFFMQFRRSMKLVRKLVIEQHYSTIVAMGGFVSGPAIYAGGGARARTILVNLDAVAGKANRRLAPRSQIVCSVHDVPELGEGVEPIGYPLRQAALATQSKQAARQALGLRPDVRTLLITGASQGAESINLAMIELAHRGKLAGWQVLHLAGAGNEAAVRDAYEQAGVCGVVLPFLDQMGQAWSAADLAISRAGAGSAAEVLANAVPTIFLPYPYHEDEHQRINVDPMGRAGAAAVLHDDIDPVANADQLELLLVDLHAHPQRLADMRSCFADMQTPNGAEQLARMLLDG